MSIWNTKIALGFFLSTVMWSGSTFGQLLINDPSFLNEAPEKSLTFSGNGYYNSTAIDNETVSLFRNGGFYHNELKNEAQDRLKNYNYIGGEYSGKIEYTDSKSDLMGGLGYYANFETAGSQGLVFSEGIFNTVFYGNTNSDSDTTVLSRIEYSGYGYQKIGFGINDKGRFKVGLGLLNFSNYQYGQLDRGILTQNTNKDTIFLNLKGDYQNAPSSSAGIGVGLDFEIVSNLLSTDSIKPEGRGFVLGIRNMGIYIGNKNTQHYSIDTTYQYSGFEINNLNEIPNHLNSENSIGDSLLPTPDNKKSFELLPAEIYFYSPIDPAGKKVQVIYGFRYRLRSATQAMINLGIDFRVSEKAHLSTSIVAGGYGYLQWGVALHKKMKRLDLGLCSNNIIGMASKESYGKSLGLTLKYTFKDGE